MDRQIEPIRAGVEHRLGNARYAHAISVLAAKQAAFGHLVVEGYRTGLYAPTAALVRTIFEDATLLAWMAIPKDGEGQAKRVRRVVINYYKGAQQKGVALPPDAKSLVAAASGSEAKKPPSFEDRVKQLDTDEANKPNGIPFWGSHTRHVAMLNNYVHSNLDGTGQFTDPRVHELLGYSALFYAHQYLVLGINAAAQLSDQRALRRRALIAFKHALPAAKAELDLLAKTGEADGYMPG